MNASKCDTAASHGQGVIGGKGGSSAFQPIHAGGLHGGLLDRPAKLSASSPQLLSERVKQQFGEAVFYAIRAQILEQQALFTQQLWDLHKLYRMQRLLSLDLQHPEHQASNDCSQACAGAVPGGQEGASQSAAARLTNHIPFLRHIPNRLRNAIRTSSLPPLDFDIFRVSPLKPGTGLCITWPTAVYSSSRHLRRFLCWHLTETLASGMLALGILT